MPPATFSTAEIKAEFYKKNNEKMRDLYHNDPEFRKRKNDARKALYKKQKELKNAQKLL